jgi:hypothetical protein
MSLGLHAHGAAHHQLHFEIDPITLDGFPAFSEGLRLRFCWVIAILLVSSNARRPSLLRNREI